MVLKLVNWLSRVEDISYFDKKLELQILSLLNWYQHYRKRELSTTLGKINTISGMTWNHFISLVVFKLLFRPHDCDFRWFMILPTTLKRTFSDHFASSYTILNKDSFIWLRLHQDLVSKYIYMQIGNCWRLFHSGVLGLNQCYESGHR